MDNENNKQQKKYYQRTWFWMLMIVVLSLVGALTYNLALGGKAGIQHHRIIVRYNRRVHQTDKVAGDKANFKMDSLETVRSKLKKKLGVSSLKNIDYAQLDKALHQLYGEKQIELIENGYMVSVNMTPSQQSDMATEIAEQVKDPKLVVGMPKHRITADITTGKYHSVHNGVQLMATNPVTILQSNQTEAWQKIKNHSVSSPQITTLPNNWIRTKVPEGLKRNNTLTGVVWIKANNGDRMRDIENVALALRFKNLENNNTAELLNTNQKEQRIYKAFTLLNSLHPFNSDYRNLKVLGGSYIPVVFSLKPFNLSSDQTATVTLNGQNYTLDIYSDKNNQPMSSLVVPK